MRSAVVVGNPKARSRTFASARLVVERLTGAPPDLSIDLVDLGPALLNWSDPLVAQLVEEVTGCALVVFASPTFKASYSGLLKLFLDRFGAGSLRGVEAVALMLGGDLRHALAPEVFLKPVLAELGASCCAPGLFLLELEQERADALETWLGLSASALGIGGLQRVSGARAS